MKLIQKIETKKVSSTFEASQCENSQTKIVCLAFEMLQFWLVYFCRNRSARLFIMVALQSI